jgi:hypothetical protein
MLGAGVCGAPPHPHGTFPHDVVIATAATRMMCLIFTMLLPLLCDVSYHARNEGGLSAPATIEGFAGTG